MAENKLAVLSTDFAVKILKLTDEIAKTFIHDCGAIRRMLIASINTVKEKQQ